MRVKTLTVLTVLTFILNGCAIPGDINIDTPDIAHTDSFTQLNKEGDSTANQYIGEHIDDIEELADAVKDIEVVPGMNYAEYLYETSDMQSDNIDIEEVKSTEFEHDLSMIDEEEIRNLIKAIYIEENASNLEIGEYYDDYIDGVYSIVCAVKIDDYWHIITSTNGVASSLKDIYGAYEYQPEE